MAKATAKKFRVPVMTRQPGHKNNDHSAASGWIEKVAQAVKDGTPAELHGLPVAYHGQAPRPSDNPIEPRPSVEVSEPRDVPASDDLTRPVSSQQYPTTHSHHAPKKSGKVPAKI